MKELGPTKSGYERYLGRWKRELKKLEAKGASLSDLPDDYAKRPMTFNEYKAKMTFEIYDIDLTKPISSYELEDKIGKKFIEQELYPRSKEQAWMMTQAVTKLQQDEYLGKRAGKYQFSISDAMLPGFEKTEAGKTFYGDLLTLYREKRGEGASGKDAKAWIAHFVFNSD